VDFSLDRVRLRGRIIPLGTIRSDALSVGHNSERSRRVGRLPLENKTVRKLKTMDDSIKISIIRTKRRQIYSSGRVLHVGEISRGRGSQNVFGGLRFRQCRKISFVLGYSPVFITHVRNREMQFFLLNLS
jgi:hypothetical protein